MRYGPMFRAYNRFDLYSHLRIASDWLKGLNREMKEITIADRPLKKFLEIFDETNEIKIIELGDTWHPADGFVDERYFKDIKTIRDLMNVDYDFKGLVIFKAIIDQITIDYNGDFYKLTGEQKRLNKIIFSKDYS